MARYTLNDLLEYISTHKADNYDMNDIAFDFSQSLGIEIEPVRKGPGLPMIDKDLIRRMYMEVLWWHGFVRFGNSIGHIMHEPIDYSCINAHDTGQASEKVLFNKIQLPDSIVTSPATDDEIVGFLRKCYRSGKMYDGSGFVNAPQVTVGSWMHFHNVAEDKHEDCAVVGLSEDGLEAKVIPLEEGRTVDDAATIQLWRYTYTPFKINEKKGLSAMMADLGLSFNPENGVFESSSPRVALGEIYWYITDRFTIRAETDRRTPTHNSRYMAGNYFTSPEKANEFLRKVLALLRPGQDIGA